MCLVCFFGAVVEEGVLFRYIKCHETGVHNGILDLHFYFVYVFVSADIIIWKCLTIISGQILFFIYVNFLNICWEILSKVFYKIKVFVRNHVSICLTKMYCVEKHRKCWKFLVNYKISNTKIIFLYCTIFFWSNLVYFNHSFFRCSFWTRVHFNTCEKPKRIDILCYRFFLFWAIIFICFFLS